jgi:hypothetical protein
MIFPVDTCSSIWYKYDWQDNDKVSWMQLAMTISMVERELAQYLGYWPAPVWIEEEKHMYPRPHRRDYYGIGLDPRGDRKAIETNYAKVISPGVRAVTLIGTATTGGSSLVYTDEASDNFYETATVTLPTTPTDPREIKAYFTGKDGEQDWEIRVPRSVEITGGNVVMRFDSWLFIDPDLYEAYPPEAGLDAIDVSTVSNFVTSVDVYREYTDSTAISARFYRESSCTLCGGSGCATCARETQDGCFHARDPEVGIIVPTAGSYDATDAQWEQVSWTDGIEPDSLHIWYQAGEQGQKYKKSLTTDPLSDFWAQTIAWLATTRLERPLCGCTNVTNLHTWLTTDLSRNTQEQSFFNPEVMLRNPFGTMRGEMATWRRVHNFVKDRRVTVALA